MEYPLRHDTFIKMEINDIQSLVPSYLLHSNIYQFVITDIEGKYVFVNEHFKQQFSFITDDFIGLPFSTTIHEEDVLKCNNAMRECVTRLKKVVSVQIRKHKKADSKDFYWTNWEFSLLKDANGQEIGISCLGYDITETEIIKKENFVFTQKVETIIENIADGLFVLNNEWRFIKVNPAAEQILDIAKEKLIGKKLSGIFSEKSYQNCLSHFQKAINENTSVRFEDYHPYLELWLRFTVYPSPEGLTVFFRDFTKEKRIREELLISERKLRAILDSTLETNILISKDLKVLSFNKVAKENVEIAFGVKIKEGDDFRRYVLREEEEKFFTAFDQALQGNFTEKEKEIHLPHASIWFRFKHLPVYDEQNEIIGVSFCVENINAQKRAEEKLLQIKNDLQNKNQLLNAILESPKGIIIFSLDKEYCYLSFTKTHKETMKYIWGEDIEVGKCMLNYIKDTEDKQKAKEHFDRVLKGEYFTEIEEYGDKNLYRTHWENRYSPMYDTESQNIIGLTVFVADITERVKNEVKVTMQNERLRAIAWQQSHEVRRPVASILGLVNLIQLEKSHERAWQLYFDHLYKATEELDTIIHRIVRDANEFD